MCFFLWEYCVVCGILPKVVKNPPFNPHGQKVFTNGKTHISRDIDSHNVSDGWKMFNKKGDRLGTYDANLNRVKD